MFSFVGIKVWLAGKHAEIWPPRHWDITDENERAEAAAWFQSEVESMEAHRNEQQRITAGQALNNLAEGFHAPNWGLGYKPFLGRDSHPTVEPLPSNGTQPTVHQQGSIHSGNPADSGDSEHSTGDESNQAGDHSSGDGDERDEWYEWPGWRPEDKLDKDS